MFYWFGHGFVNFCWWMLCFLVKFNRWIWTLFVKYHVTLHNIKYYKTLFYKNMSIEIIFSLVAVIDVRLLELITPTPIFFFFFCMDLQISPHFSYNQHSNIRKKKKSKYLILYPLISIMKLLEVEARWRILVQGLFPIQI